MKQIITIKNQNIFDIAVQEYGTQEAAFTLIAGNPQLNGQNDLPDGYNMPKGSNFDISYPIKAGTVLNIQDYIEIEKTGIAKQLNEVIS